MDVASKQKSSRTHLLIGAKSSSNILFQGDNINILPALRSRFENKIKLIYIDPPYNTGNSFDHYLDDLTHENWLSMMEARLVAMHPLLHDEGSLWISIDETELHYLKVLCDRIFGRKNFVTTIIWEKKFSASNDSKYISSNHEYVLVYAKNKAKWKVNLLPRTELADSRYSNPDNDPRGLWTPSDLTVKTPSPSYIYPIKTPTGRTVWPSQSRSWALSKEGFFRLVEDNRIWFGTNGNNIPRLKRFLSEVKPGLVPKTLWTRDEVGDTQEAKKESKKINGNEVFTTPKPERLLQRIIELASNEGDWVLDAFAGTGTTGAVAHKLKRKWVMIEINGSCQSHCLPRMKGLVSGKDITGTPITGNFKGGGGFKYIKS